MAWLQLFRKQDVGFSALRRFSAASSWSAPESCLIRGAMQDIAFHPTRLESLADHAAKYPLVTPIAAGELIDIDPLRPYEISSHWRPIFHSGFLHSYLCKEKGDCISKAFEYDNVGVIKDINILGFKKFHRVQGIENRNHIEYCSFVEDTFSRFGGPLPARFEECLDFLKACVAYHLDDDFLRYHSFFLEDEVLADLYSDVHRLVRQEFKHRGKGKKGRAILRAMESHYKNSDVIRDSMRHQLLQFLLGSHCPVERKTKLLKGQRPLNICGSAVVDIHRIAMHHSIEDNTLKDARLMYPQQQKLWDTFSRVDVVKALRYIYPKYPSEAILAFKKAGVFDTLGMHRRLPSQHIYSYISPGYGHVGRHP